MKLVHFCERLADMELVGFSGIRMYENIVQVNHNNVNRYLRKSWEAFLV